MNPLLHDLTASMHGHGTHGVRYVRFVPSGAPGGYSAVELVYLFPTLKERDDCLRKLRRRWRGSRKNGPVIETFEVDVDVDVASVHWFEQMYRRTAVIADLTEHRYGTVRIYDTKPPRYYVRYAENEVDLRRMLTAQWQDAAPAPVAGEPRALYDVGFFTADESLQLRLVIEVDDDEDADQ